jgi:hypothetical protein
MVEKITGGDRDESGCKATSNEEMKQSPTQILLTMTQSNEPSATTSPS